jgi:hypothetical protein
MQGESTVQLIPANCACSALIRAIEAAISSFYMRAQ